MRVDWKGKKRESAPCSIKRRVTKKLELCVSWEDSSVLLIIKFSNVSYELTTKLNETFLLRSRLLNNTVSKEYTMQFDTFKKLDSPMT